MEDRDGSSQQFFFPVPRLHQQSAIIRLGSAPGAHMCFDTGQKKEQWPCCEEDTATQAQNSMALLRGGSPSVNVKEASFTFEHHEPLSTAADMTANVGKGGAPNFPHLRCESATATEPSPTTSGVCVGGVEPLAFETPAISPIRSPAPLQDTPKNGKQSCPKSSIVDLGNVNGEILASISLWSDPTCCHGVARRAKFSDLVGAGHDYLGRRGKRLTSRQTSPPCHPPLAPVDFRFKINCRCIYYVTTVGREAMDARELQSNSTVSHY